MKDMVLCHPNRHGSGYCHPVSKKKKKKVIFTGASEFRARSKQIPCRKKKVGACKHLRIAMCELPGASATHKISCVLAWRTAFAGQVKNEWADKSA